ncbi:unannotated protein [freshwater metagenome]|uniref:Unannotated protein n=1 Tax=freshwater metagenome TaxID=449393 RepID=A0A6J6X0V6_9ZZZZ
MPTQHELQGLLHGREQFASELVVIGNEDVVIETGRDVGTDVGVESRVLDGTTDVVVKPAAIAELDIGQPLVGPLRFGHTISHREGHGCFDVVPGVTVATGKPGNLAVGQLQIGEVA